MSLDDLAAELERGDPDRFLALMAAPPGARRPLLALYTFNLEIARAPWRSAEPMIAEMRLQWWRDTVEELGQGKPPRGHAVAEALAPLMGCVPADLLDRMIEARRHDIARANFTEAGALVAYLDATGGHLMWAAASALGAPGAAEEPVRLYARAAALAAWLRAVPALESAGLTPLPDGRPQAVAGLAREGLGWLGQARRMRALVPARARPALLPGWQAGPQLRMAAASPERVAAGQLDLSEFARRGRLLWQAATGRW